MTETAMIALVILVGSFSVLIVTILTRGTNSALRLWAGLGPLLGAITTFYFTDKTGNEIVTLTEANAALTGENEFVALRIDEEVDGILNELSAARENVAASSMLLVRGEGAREISQATERVASSADRALAAIETSVGELRHVPSIAREAIRSPPPA